jgi:hypothetical protein
MDSLTQKVDDYFENHLDRTEWLTFSDAERCAAVTMASRQIICELGVEKVDIENIFHYCALSEQALFLALNRKRRMPEENNGMIVVAESVDGVGSKQYAAAGGNSSSGDRAEDVWSRRALSYLAKAGNSCTNISRG